MREIFAILFSVITFEKFLRGNTVDFFTDNQSVAKIVRRGSIKPWLHYIALCIHSFANKHQIKINPFWIPREMNAQADFISKFIDWDDWKISRGLFRFFEAKWGAFTVDLFENHLNTQCSKFYSRFWCPGTAGVDALNYSWLGENGWCVPPFRLIPRILRHFEKFGDKLVLLVPYWPSAPFYPLLCKHSPFFKYITDQVYVEKAYRFIVPQSQNSLCFLSTHQDFTMIALKLSSDH